LWVFLPKSRVTASVDSKQIIRTLVCRHPNPSNGFSLWLDTENNVILTLFDNQDARNANRQRKKPDLKSTQSLPCGQWVWIIATFDCTQSSLFVNGTCAASGVDDRSPVRDLDDWLVTVGDLPLTLRSWAKAATSTHAGNERVLSDVFALMPGSGQLADVRLYTRTVSADEIKATWRTEYSSIQEPCFFAAQLRDMLPFPLESAEQQLLRAWRTGEHAFNSFGKTKWTATMDEQVVELFILIAGQGSNRRGLSEAVPLVDMCAFQPQFFAQDVKEAAALFGVSRSHDKQIQRKFSEIRDLATKFPALAGLPLSDVLARFELLQIFNRKVEEILPLVDFSQMATAGSLAHGLSSMSSTIFAHIKKELFDQVLESTAEGTHLNVQLNEDRAKKAREQAENKEPVDITRTLFHQTYEKFNFLPPTQLRYQFDKSSDQQRVWQVNFTGLESMGIDAGGLFRDHLTRMCEELQSATLPLFIQCYNKTKWIPNPSCTKPLHLQMYKFLGKLMGVAIRARLTLDLDIADVVWKPLVGKPLQRQDIVDIDDLSFKRWDSVNEAKTAEDLASRKFTTNTSDSRGIELKEGGANFPITLDNRDEYLRLEQNYRLTEFDRQVNAIKQGLSTIVPIQMLSLFGCRELEIMVCGDANVDIKYLRENTDLSSMDDRKEVDILFKVLESFTQAQRRDFLRFTWGRGRLPVKQSDFTQKFKITPGARNPRSLPVAHTCFFSIELPPYRSEEECRNKLLYAIGEASFAMG